MSEMKKSEKTREKILKATRKLIVAQGFHNTSISEIIEASGVKKGNLYYYFSSKEELGLAVLEDAKNEFFQIVEKTFNGNDPVAKINNFLEAIFREQQNNNFVGGCLFGNTALEMSDSNPQFSDVISEVFQRWTSLIKEPLAEAQNVGKVVNGQSPELLAKLIIAAIEGGIMMSRVSKSEDDLAQCLSSLKAIIMN